MATYKNETSEVIRCIPQRQGRTTNHVYVRPGEEVKMERSDHKRYAERIKLTPTQAEPETTDEPVYPEGEPSGEWTVAEIKAYLDDAGTEYKSDLNKAGLLAVATQDEEDSSDTQSQEE